MQRHGFRRGGGGSGLLKLMRRSEILQRMNWGTFPHLVFLSRCSCGPAGFTGAFWVNQSELRDHGRPVGGERPLDAPSHHLHRSQTTSSAGPSGSHRHLFIRMFGTALFHGSCRERGTERPAAAKNTHLPKSNKAFKVLFTSLFTSLWKPLKISFEGLFNPLLAASCCSWHLHLLERRFKNKVV